MSEQVLHRGLGLARLARLLAEANDREVVGARVLAAAPDLFPSRRVSVVLDGETPVAPSSSVQLVAPILLGKRRLGALSVTAVDGQPISDADREMAAGVAALVAVAMDRLQLGEALHDLRHEALRAAPRPGGGRSDHRLHDVMRDAVDGTAADFALVALLVDDERLLIQAGLGPLAEEMVGNMMAVQDSVAAPVLRSGEPILVTDYARDGAAAIEIRPQIGSVIVTPLRTRDRIEGALAVGRVAGRPSFVHAQLDDLTQLVQSAAGLRELDDAREERRSARLVEDRIRFAADLHDHVIQEIFAAGMGLQAVAGSMPDHDDRGRILQHVDALDRTVRRIRALINDLPRGDSVEAPLPLNRRLVAILDSFTPALPSLPTIEFAGPVESSVPGDLALDLEAVLREALANVARHAGASSVHVRVSVSDGHLVLDVIDDGTGIGRPRRSSGVTNMRRRAKAHRGSLQFTTPEGGGTHLQWTTPLQQPD